MERLALAAILLVFALRLVAAATSHSLTADEPHYLGTGAHLWQTGDYHFARTLKFQPPLAYHLASLPLLAVDRSALRPTNDVTEQLVASGAIGRHALRVASRLPFVLLACWGAFLVFAWGREAAGPDAGLAAALVYTLSPMLLAHGAIAHSDITVCVLYTQTLYAAWRWHRSPSALRLLLCGASLGLALLAKYSALLLLPTLFLLWLGALPRRSEPTPGLPWIGPDDTARRARWLAGCFAALLGIAIVVLWLGYGGSFAAVAEPGSRHPDVALPGWLQPFFFFVEANETGRRVFFLGEFANQWPGAWFFPVAWAIKTPIGILVLLGLALGTLRHTPSPLGRFLGVPVLVFGLVALFWIDVPMGLRYLLPLYPLAALFIGTQCVALRGGATRALAAVALAWATVAGLWIHPHYLAYFNETIGGPRHGHRYLLDANLDWGQDLPALAEALRERGDPVVRIAYFGPERPAWYGIRSQPLVDCTPVGGLVAISANVRGGLYAVRNLFAEPTPGCYDWLLDAEPVARPGWSLFLYDLPMTAVP